MNAFGNPGRRAGLWYLILVVLGPLRLIYIPNKLLVLEDPAATVHNIAAHQVLFRCGIVTDLAAGIVLIFLVLAFYRLFGGLDRFLAAQVILFGGVMPALLYFVNAVSDLGALMIVQGTEFLSAFSKPQQNAIVILLLRLHNYQNTAAETLWGVWLLPLGLLVFRCRVLPRFLGIWLVLDGIAYVAISMTGILLPAHQQQVFLLLQPALFGELALMLWLVIRGAPLPVPAVLSSHAGRNFD